MSAALSLVEWLHEHRDRSIIIRAAGYTDESGEWHPREHAATFTLTTKLPDGRTVQSSVSVLDELLLWPEAGDIIVQEAKTAIECFLHRGR